MRRGLSFRSGNPALTKDTFNNAVSDGSNQVMTLEGTVNKSALGLIILLVCAFYTFSDSCAICKGDKM